MSNIRTYRVNHAMQMISIPLHSTTNSYHLDNNREVVDAKGVVQQVTNYYPFGTPYADATASKGADVQPYKYNGKEFDLMHGLNTYDYGARQHDPILARWDRIDPLCEKYYSTSPYAYCANNPVIFVDPDGEAIRLSISNIASDQKGTIKVCTNDGARYKAYVPLYPLTVTDDEHDVTTSYFVTRDAPCTDNGGQSFYNKAFEPNKAIGEYTGIFVNEYKDTGHGGILLQENGGSALSTDPQRPGDKVGEAIGIFIHVGGYYEKKDLKTYLTGSLGCLGIANRQIDEFINDIMGRLENCEDKTIIINIAKRNDVEWETDGKEWSVQPF